MDCYLAAALRSLRQSVLVIGYGNSLRCDDGVGQSIAKELAGWGLPNVEAIATHQLTPELAEAVAQVDLVIFVDAYPATAAQDVQIRPLTSAATGTSTGHWCEPQTVLALARSLYGAAPQACWVMVPGVNFGLGQKLSLVATQGMEAALQAVEQLIKAGRTEPCMKSG